MEIKVENISKSINGRNILNHLSLIIENGQCMGLVGPNGAGKTSLIRVLLGLYQSDGIIYFNGKKKEKIDVVNEKILFILDSSNLFYRLSVSENVEFFVRVYRKELNKKEIHEEVMRILEKVELVDYADENIRVLSRGMRQRLCIGRTMIVQPDFFILDEPYLGLDVEAQIFLTDYLIDLKKKGTTILISSHDLSHMEKVCDYVAFIKKGSVLQTFEISQSKKVSIEEQYKKIIIEG